MKRREERVESRENTKIPGNNFWLRFRFLIRRNDGRRTLLSPLSSQLSQGFTMIELLVVVAIIGMMTAVVAVNSNAARVQSRDAKRKADLALVAGALQIYYSEQRKYPSAPMGDWSGALQTALFPTDAAKPRYMSLWPTDPTGTDGIMGKGFVYQTNQANIVALNNLPADALYILDVTLEGKDTPTNSTTAINCANSADPNFYLSGIFLCSTDNKYHDRISSR